MKLKNIMKDVRQLRIAGQVVEVKPGETIEGDKIVYDDRVFQIVDIQKRKEKIEEPTKLEEDK